MKKETNVRVSFMILIGVIFLAGTIIQARAQTPTENPVQPAPAQTQTPANQAPDALGQLSLTPEQIQKIRAINTELKDQRQTANQRLRQSQRALAEALESPTPT